MMVGEIRDRETAQIAIQASLTGHRVLSTLHTMNGPGAITRLIDMGIEPFLVSSAISLIIGQRLVRKICGHCAEPDVVSPIHLRALGFDHDMVATMHAMKGDHMEYMVPRSIIWIPAMFVSQGPTPAARPSGWTLS